MIKRDKKKLKRSSDKNYEEIMKGIKKALKRKKFLKNQS